MGTLKGRGYNDVHPEHDMNTHIPVTLAMSTPTSSSALHRTVMGAPETARVRCRSAWLGPLLHEGSKSGHIHPQPLPDLLIEEPSRRIEHLISVGHVEHSAKPGLHA